VCGLDLCTGTGSNLRYLLDRLPGRQHWLVVDRDAALLDEVPTRLATWARAKGCTVATVGRVSRLHGDHLDAHVETRQMNLDRLDGLLFEGRNLVTASALLDLVSESWLRTLATRCRAARAAALFSITYNGQWSCDPREPEDDLVRQLMNLHQKTDKGLGGAAAGPEAWVAAEHAFVDAGYRVERATSDWSIEPSDREFQRELIEGWAFAASEIAPRYAASEIAPHHDAPHQAGMIADWLRRRLEQVDAGRSRIVVGHVDMAALPGE
jgi:hypothetical protein